MREFFGLVSDEADAIYTVAAAVGVAVCVPVYRCLCVCVCLAVGRALRPRSR